MHVTLLVAEEEATSTAGTVLFAAALAVVVAAVVAVALGGLGPCTLGGPCQDRTPLANLNATADAGADGWGTGDETVTVVHEGGNEVVLHQVSLEVGGDPLDGVAWPDGETWTNGERATYTGTVDENETVFVVWTAPDGDVHQILTQTEAD